MTQPSFMTNSDVNLESRLSPDARLQINASLTFYRSQYFVAYRSDFLDGGFDPKNHLTKLDENFVPISHMTLKLEDGNSAFEDVRLFVYKAKLMAVYTYMPKVKDSWLWENGVGIAEVDFVSGMLVNQQSLRFLRKQVHEKNYVPLIENDELFLVTEFEPALRVIRVEGEVGNFTFNELNTDLQFCYRWPFGEIRGGTPFVKHPYKNDSWHYSFVHSSLTLPNGNSQSKFYLYTLIRVDLKRNRIQLYANPLGYSKPDDKSVGISPWILKSRKNISIRVVFPMGITNYRSGVLVSLGQDDCISRLKYYSWDYIDQLFS